MVRTAGLTGGLTGGFGVFFSFRVWQTVIGVIGLRNSAVNFFAMVLNDIVFMSQCSTIQFFSAVDKFFHLYNSDSLMGREREKKFLS